MYVTLYGNFCLNEGGAADCVNRTKAKSPAKWGVQIAGMIFQTRSSLVDGLCGTPAAYDPYSDEHTSAS